MTSQTFEKWQCSYCNHSLYVDPKHIDIINIAKVRHLLANHRMSIMEILKFDGSLLFAVYEFLNSAVLTYRNQLEDVF
jgi:heterodisulfide reductase subunit C